MLGGRIRRVDDFDTDTLGSFTREIPRAGTQLEAARQKARIGMTRAGLARGLGSEGAFGADPFAGLVPWNVEILALIDDALGVELVGVAQGPAVPPPHRSYAGRSRPLRSVQPVKPAVPADAPDQKAAGCGIMRAGSRYSPLPA